MTDLPAPVAALLDAANANDTEAFLHTLAPDAVVDDWGREFRGHEAIRGVMQGAIDGLFRRGEHEFVLDATVVDGDYALITWSLTFPGGTIPFWLDSFLIRDGKIVMQAGGVHLVPRSDP
jgi:ketosteroid isomerase-like protein